MLIPGVLKDEHYIAPVPGNWGFCQMSEGLLLECDGAVAMVGDTYCEMEMRVIQSCPSFAHQHPAPATILFMDFDTATSGDFPSASKVNCYGVLTCLTIFTC